MRCAAGARLVFLPNYSPDLNQIEQAFGPKRKEASLRIHATPTGRLMVNVIGSVAQLEREIMLERQREGVQRANREGKYKGRAPGENLRDRAKCNA